MRTKAILFLLCGYFLVLNAQTTDFRDTRDRKVYKTVQIGNQLWMAENLNYDAGKGSWAYDKDPSNTNIYGRLYNYKIAKNICPTNWHLASYEEWDALSDYLGGGATSGGKMKESGTSHWQAPNEGGTNVSGFSVLPGGLFMEGKFELIGSATAFWGTYGIDTATLSMFDNETSAMEISPVDGSGEMGASVRCVYDKPQKSKPLPKVMNNNPVFGSLTDSRDGQNYRTVQIGKQTWMAENLNFDAGLSEDGKVNSTPFKGSQYNAETYGQLYVWEIAKKVCPSGWHLPSKTEWEGLSGYLGGEETAGGKMKTIGTMQWNEPNTGATNQSGFSSLPGGMVWFAEEKDLGDIASFWSSSSLNLPDPYSNPGNAWYVLLFNNSEKLALDSRWINNYHSVRCIKD